MAGYLASLRLDLCRFRCVTPILTTIPSGLQVRLRGLLPHLPYSRVTLILGSSFSAGLAQIVQFDQARLRFASQCYWDCMGTGQWIHVPIHDGFLAYVASRSCLNATGRCLTVLLCFECGSKSGRQWRGAASCVVFSTVL